MFHSQNLYNNLPNLQELTSEENVTGLCRVRDKQNSCYIFAFEVVENYLYGATIKNLNGGR